MALVLSTTAKYLSRASGLLPLTGDFTVMFWTYNVSAPATTPTTGWAEIDAYPLSTDGVQLSTGTHPGSFYRAEYTGGFFAQVEEWTTYYGNGVWNHHAITYDSATGNATMYVNGSAVSVTTFSLNPLTVALEVLGNNGTSTVANHKFIYYRSWDAVLSSGDINAERLSQTVVRSADLWMDTPLTADANDISGNGRNWTVNGSVSYDATDPIAPPVSYYDITATPFSQLFTAADFNAGTYGGVANQLWLRYVSDADQVFAINSTDPFSTFHVPALTVYADNGVSVLANWSGVLKSGGVRVLNAGTYYIRIQRSSSVAAADQNFTVAADVLGWITSVADNVGIINDDADGFPALAFQTDGTFLGFIENIPAGEMGDALPSGISIWHDRYNTDATKRLKLIARDLTTIAQLDLPTPLGSTFPRFAHSDTDFYVSNDANPSEIFSVTDTGTAALVATLSGTYDQAYAIAVDADGTILYYITSSADDTIRRWDLVNDVALSDLYVFSSFSGFSHSLALTPNGHPGDILRMTDGSLVTSYRNNTTGEDTIVQISAAGALVHSYTLSTQYAVDHLAYNASDPNAVNVWLFDNNTFFATGLIGVYDLTTGTFTESFTTELYSELISLDTDTGQFFGPSNSCTMVTILSGAAPTTATLTVVKVTVPSPDTTNTYFDFTTTGGLTPSTFSLQDGDSQVYTDLAADTYGVDETVPDGWTVSYSVSNGDQPDAITLAAGDAVTVTVTNTNRNAPNRPGNTTRFPIRWLRRAPHLCDEQVRMFHKRLQVDCQVGVGLTAGAVDDPVQGQDPQMMLRWSDDGGHTWSNEHWASMGPIGAYRTRVQWYRLGMSRNRVYELSGSDPVKVAIIDAYLDVEAGLS